MLSQAQLERLEAERKHFRDAQAARRKALRNGIRVAVVVAWLLVYSASKLVDGVGSLAVLIFLPACCFLILSAFLKSLPSFIVVGIIGALMMLNQFDATRWDMADAQLPLSIMFASMEITGVIMLSGLISKSIEYYILKATRSDFQ